MDDYGQAIAVDIEFAEIQGDKELGSSKRFLLGYVSLAYVSDVDFSLIVYYKRDNNMAWENTGVYTIDKDEERFHIQLPQNLTCIDAYPRVYGSVKEFKITSCKLYIKIINVGKFGG